jgi:AcrR family transcriptional regulator
VLSLRSVDAITDYPSVNILARVEARVKRRGRPSQGARDAVLAAALELFVERDYDEVSTEEIVERSGVSRGALYHHFPTKLILFRAVFQASERRVLEGIAARVSVVAGSPFEMLLESARAYLRAAETDVELQRIGLGQSRAVLGWQGWREAASELGIGFALAGVTAAIEAGELPPHDPEALAIIVLGAMIEAAMLIVVADDRAAARERSEAVVSELLLGLRR